MPQTEVILRFQVGVNFQISSQQIISKRNHQMLDSEIYVANICFLN